MSASTGSESPQSEARAHGAERALVEAAVAAAVVYVVAGGAEAALVRAFRPSELELTWVSDVVLSVALGVAVYLWRHLRATRQALSVRQREGIVLQTQLAIAADMQRRLLPAVPAPTSGFEWGALLLPAGRIGGDFYDFVERSPGELLVLIADVSGKGIPAAMALSLLRSTFRALATETQSPAQLVTRLSALVHDEWNGSPYVTCIVARLDVASGTLTYTNAGHPPGTVVSHGVTARSLNHGGQPAGLLPGASFHEDRVHLTPGDLCVLVTDGITEAFGDTVDMPHEVLAAYAISKGSPQVLCQTLMDRALEGNGPGGVADWEDDRTVVVVAARP